MKVYKYRGVDFFERDLNSLEENYFWGATYDTLNDPFEALVLDDRFNLQSQFFENIFGSTSGFSTKDIAKSLSKLKKLRFKMGICSLSKTYDHELLWAHYGSSHQGFCIEYDLEKLINNMYQQIYHFDVDYSSHPPFLDWKDLLAEKELLILKKIAGTKSKSWSYEEEIRLITDESGKKYYEYDALSAIYFGHRMSEKNKGLIMKKMRGREIKYYQIKLKENSYEFKREKVLDKFKSSNRYFFNVPDQGQEFKVINKSFNRFSGKATIDIELPDKKVNKKQLSLIAYDVRNKIFPMAERIFMLYYLPDMQKDSGAWATTHFVGNEIKVEINGLTQKEEDEFVKYFLEDERDIRGRWLDDTPFVPSIRILFRNDGKIYLETKFRDGSSSIEEMLVSKDTDGIRYDYKNDRGHGEYFIVTDKSELLFVSENGVFKNISKFELPE